MDQGGAIVDGVEPGRAQQSAAERSRAAEDRCLWRNLIANVPRGAATSR